MPILADWNAICLCCYMNIYKSGFSIQSKQEYPPIVSICNILPVISGNQGYVSNQSIFSYYIYVRVKRFDRNYDISLYPQGGAKTHNKTQWNIFMA